MITFKPKDPDFDRRVRSDFDRQRAMKTLGVEIARLEPGIVDLTMPYSIDFTQQHGFLHAGTVTTALDTACGYAAFTLMPADAAVLTIEFKTNLLAPAKGEYFIFRARVVKPGRTISVSDALAFAVDGAGQEKLIASMSATLMTMIDRPGVNQ